MMSPRLLFSLFVAGLLSIGLYSPEIHAQTRSKSKRATPRRPMSKKVTTPANASRGAVTTPSGLTYMITRHGTGRQPKTGETVVLNYTGTLLNGAKFDSSFDRNQPLAFKLGVSQVIKGWDEGVAKLRAGDSALLVIPGDMAYGPTGAGDVIPPNATLIFIVELLDVKTRSMTDVLTKTLNERGVEAMITDYHSLRNSGDRDLYVSESQMNAFGYYLLRRGQINEAIEVLKLNVEGYPQSANVYDSLAEAYLVSGNKVKAIENYQKALAIDPTMESAKQALKKLTGQ